MFRSLGRCGICLLVITVAIVAALMFATLSPRGQWASQELVWDLQSAALTWPPDAALAAGTDGANQTADGANQVAAAADAAADAVAVAERSVAELPSTTTARTRHNHTISDLGASPGSHDQLIAELPNTTTARARLNHTIHDLRASLGPHDQLIAEEDSDVSMIVSIALTLNNLSHTYNYSHAQAAWWAKAIFAINKEHCKTYGHPIVLRHAPIVHSRQALESCANMSGSAGGGCLGSLNRQASTWGKIVMMRDMLELPGVVYVLCLDADAVFAHMRRDTVREFAQLLEANPGRDMLLTNEDWRHQGVRTINTGMMFARSTNFTRKLFGSLLLSFAAGAGGPAYPGPGDTCKNNEQTCLNTWWNRVMFPGIHKRLLVVSSVGRNFSPCVWFWCPDMFPKTVDKNKACHACKLEERCPKKCDLRLNDSQIEIVHFMGDSRFYIDLVMPLLPQP